MKKLIFLLTFLVLLTSCGNYLKNDIIEEYSITSDGGYSMYMSCKDYTIFTLWTKNNEFMGGSISLRNNYKFLREDCMFIVSTDENFFAINKSVSSARHAYIYPSQTYNKELEKLVNIAAGSITFGIPVNGDSFDHEWLNIDIPCRECHISIDKKEVIVKTSYKPSNKELRKRRINNLRGELINLKNSLI